MSQKSTHPNPNSQTLNAKSPPEGLRRSPAQWFRGFVTICRALEEDCGKIAFFNFALGDTFV